MKARNEDALVCDFAETYRIYDYTQLPPKQAAIFAAGLPADSRIKVELSGQKLKPDTMLLAGILDCLNIQIWMNTKDGHKNRNRPKSMLKELTEEKEEYMEFDSIEAYEAARERMMRN